ncbi:hypothetical protein [Kallotenue papyrolyticum]|uniref:hypothetical protein n=1 Tax=Kallotenue papyrolyticum TaxID=1325125 RepID=UPI00047206B3|nr:hypothetical protein [Kallotenue papyrolyticum]
MARSSQAAAPRAVDRALVLLLIGAALLIGFSLLSLVLVRQRTPPLAPADTPEGVVQRFYQAAYAGDYAAAHALLSRSVAARVTPVELERRLSADLRNTQLRVLRVRSYGDSADVEIELLHVAPGGLFGAHEWREERTVVLRREDGQWRISEGAFYLPWE